MGGRESLEMTSDTWQQRPLRDTHKCIENQFAKGPTYPVIDSLNICFYSTYAISATVVTR